MKKEELKKFVEFSKTLLESLDQKPEYSWFFEEYQKEIITKFFVSNSGSSFNKFDSITTKDIHRIKSYLNFIDRKAINYGRVFYKNISDDQLKKDLINDFKEMKIALKQDNTIEFGRRVCLQIENAFNFSLREIDVHNLILNNKAYYQNFQPSWANKPFNLYKAFFMDIKDLPREPRGLSEVNFKMKSLFLSAHFEYRFHVGTFNDLYFLRNKGSHRDKLSVDDKKKLRTILSEFDKNYSYYHKVLFDVMTGLKNLY